MEKCAKDFRRWAEIAESVEKRSQPVLLKVGAVYWCHFGVGIGTELYGKGREFTRPGLVLAEMMNDLILAIPMTSKVESGANYMPVMIGGGLRYLNLTQVRPMSVRRIGDYIDEVDYDSLLEIKKRYLRFLKYRFYRKSNPD